MGSAARSAGHANTAAAPSHAIQCHCRRLPAGHLCCILHPDQKHHLIIFEHSVGCRADCKLFAQTDAAVADQKADFTTPPSTRSAAPVVAADNGLAT
jgi:hypothetical protein